MTLSWRQALYPVLEPARCIRFMQAARVLAPLRSEDGFSNLFDRLAASRFAPIQIKSEIVPLCELIHARKPRTICEIGAASGGTLFLFSRCAFETATLLSIDLNYAPSKLRSFPSLGMPGQTIRVMKADSHSAETAKQAAALLSGAGIDFLFVDGDHSYDGVAADYALFAPLVKADGLIGFHDIVADFRQRFGVRRNADSGGVPRFWSELKARHGEAAAEFVENPEQDGFGIGILDLRRMRQGQEPPAAY